MKGLYICFIFLFSVSLIAQSKKVKVKIVQYIPYCGGAKPTDEIQAATKKAKPYSNKKLIVVSQKGLVDSVTTDVNGYFKKTLAFGIYNVYEPWKYYKLVPKGFQISNINMECLKEEWSKPDIKISISKSIKLLEDNLKYPKCPYQFPCLINKHFPQ